jgi:predicted TIM-barrel fold metal-dependent hydrolase
MKAVYQLCAQANMPVIFHTGSTAQKDAEPRYIHPHDFLPILQDHPEMVCILAHAGKPDWCEEALALTERFENVYVDTALVNIQRLLDLGLARRPAQHKVLFGSDWPVCGGLMARIGQLDMPAALRQAIMYENAAGLLKRFGWSKPVSLAA